MSVDRHFTDEEITAYLDGETEFAPVEEIEAALEEDEALQERMASMTFDADRFDEAFKGLLPEAPAMPSLLPKKPELIYRPSKGYGRIAAAACLALAMGFGAGTLLTAQEEDGWHEYVAAYQALYITKTLDHVDRPREVAEAELTRVTNAIGIDISLDQLSSQEGLNYKRGQVLGYEGKPLIQLAFLTDDGKPIALCIIKSRGGQKSNMDVGQMEGMKSATWSNGEFDFLLIGGDDEMLIKKAGLFYSKQI